MLIEKVLGLSRPLKNVIALTADVFSLTFALWFALSVRFETLFIPPDGMIPLVFGITLLLSFVIFYRLGLYRTIVRYIGNSALFGTLLGVVASGTVLFALDRLFSAGIPLSVVINYTFTALLLLFGSRMLVRLSANRQLNIHRERVLIFGAGTSGRQLVQALSNGSEFYPVGFVDDDCTLHHSRMLGLEVFPPQQLQQLIERFAVKRVLLAMPRATKSERKRILELLEPLPIQVQTIPDMDDLVSGETIDRLVDVEVEDLLGRDPVPPHEHLMDKNIRGKRVMVTGAGGSIGSELCRQILLHEPEALILFEMSEYALYAIEEELQQIRSRHELKSLLFPITGTVQGQERMEMVMKGFNVQTVYHAAAYKHVPMVEFNMVEAVLNNVFGTWYAAEAAINTGVESFVLVSTDKAVRPTNVMGATKRFAELVLQSLSARQDWTCFCMVRFGNVLGSSGSVVPKFSEQIRKGGPITVTDPEITRYFMTIPEAAQLVIQAGAMSCNGSGSGGDVFVLDMGEPIKIDQLARKLVRLMGKSVRDQNYPNGDIEIEYSGLRPGEKLYEELLIGNNVQETDHPRIMTAKESFLYWDELEPLLNTLLEKCEKYCIEDIHAILLDAPLEFTPQHGISDLVWSVS